MNDFQTVFLHLKAILQPYQSQLVMVHDLPNKYYLNLHHTRKDGYQIFFGSAEIKKSYVSYHLQAIYFHPELLEGVSENLKKQMQGKACFNFKKLEPELLAELEALTQTCLEKFKEVGLS